MAKGVVPGPGGGKMDVPCHNELRPFEYDSEPGRGPLSHVPSGVHPIHDLGAPTMTYEQLYGGYQRPTLAATSSSTEHAENIELGKSSVKKGRDTY